MLLPYDPISTEAKWQKKWEDAKAYKVDVKKAKNPYYNLVMFPYPSGDKLHVGHWYNFAPADSWGRFMRMHGKDVFEPFGFDAFGLPAENYAIKTGVHPNQSIRDNVLTMIRQLKRIGCMYDWDKMVNTSQPDYYRWTQWLFLKMYEKDLAYKKKANVNWCPKDQTVLANEQVQDGKCERCGSEIDIKPLEQWFWKITDYSQRLLDGLEGLNWPEKTKTMQRNWIGRSEGAEVQFDLADTKRGIVPMNWHKENDMLAADLNRQLTDEQNVLVSDGETLAPDFNRGLTMEEGKRIHSRRTVHLVFTPHRREAAFQDEASAASILRILGKTAKHHNIMLHEAAAMPNHVHLLVSFDADRHLENDVVKKLKDASAREYLKRFGGIHAHLWGQKKHFEEVTSQRQFDATISYIQQNPMNDKIDASGRILSELPLTITVFTTRVDTLFSAAFLVLAPEHELVDCITTADRKVEVEKYKQEVSKKTELQRTDLAREKTGVFTGAHAINPANGEKIPVWIGDFVLAHYGHGAVFGDAHDERDFIFAKKYNIPLKTTIKPEDGSDDASIRALEVCFTDDGILDNSAEFTGQTSAQARVNISKWLEKKGKGKMIINYRLRDWLVSRQRYWGAPIPIVYDPEGRPHPVPEKHLPWLLPTDVEFKPTGKSPLTYSKEFIERTEKIFGKGWRPEFDTMDTFVCSSFYYLRYLMEGHATEFVDKKLEKKWMPVSMYIGGPEHACMHLIYARFVMMALHDWGIVSYPEPFQTLVHQGFITNKGAKMSKSKGNVVSPDELVDQHGSDVFRMFLMFMGPFTQGGDWSDTGIRGIDRFVQRLYKLFSEKLEKSKPSKKSLSAQGQPSPAVGAGSAIDHSLHSTMKKVTEEIGKMQFNTAISALMEFLNILEKQPSISVEVAQTIAKLLAPLAPHLAEELWAMSGGPSSVKATEGKKGFVIDQKWPEYDPKMLITKTIAIVVQVNGKLRANIEVDANASQEDILKLAKEQENVRKFLEGRQPKKEIYVKGKLVSLVI